MRVLVGALGLGAFIVILFHAGSPAVGSEGLPGRPEPGRDAPTCTGCSAHPHQGAEPPADTVDGWLRRWWDRPEGAESPELDRLVHHAAIAERRLLFGDLIPEGARKQRLLSELRRPGAIIELRLVDDAGEVLTSTGPCPVPFGQKRHLAASRTEVFGEFSGSVLRTTRDHLWVRW